MATYFIETFRCLLFIFLFFNKCCSSKADYSEDLSLVGSLSMGCGDNKLTKAVLSFMDQMVQPLREEITNLKTEISDMRASHATELINMQSKFEFKLLDIRESLKGPKHKSKNGFGRINQDGDPGFPNSRRCEGDERGGKRQDDRTSKRTNDLRRQSPEVRVAFFAKKTNATLHLGIGQHVVFDSVVTNIGNAYDSSIGVFKAPVSGVYLITVSLTTYLRDVGHFALFINQRQETWFYLNGAMNSWDETSQTIIVHLDESDDVTVRSVFDVDHGIHGENHSIFAGTLLFMDEEQSGIIGK